MSSAIPHVVAFLTRPLLAAFSPAAVSSAQVILAASLASVPSATYTLTASTPPAPLFAASIGANIPWAAWFAVFATDEILLFYGPGYVKARLGGADSPVTDIWSEETQGSIVPISRGLRQHGGNTIGTASLRALLLSARARRDQDAAAQPIRIPSLPFSSTSSDSDSDSDSDYCDDSDSASSTSSKFTSYSTESLTSAGSSPTIETPSKSVATYRPPFARSKAAIATTMTKPRTAPTSMNRAKKDTTAYLYQGGVTRVMTGGVMLGPRSTRS
ncbi:hypothetical protein B0H12DRAFT_94850 [Mycena haematopus]|nr:hypothetical protein B0H12DRAFT_94850 [Mycena haematopus]